ncbi:MAG: PAS domain S-box protein [Gemmatimonadales bacterium]|jgi:PAS domain S-box-containing protein
MSPKRILIVEDSRTQAEQLKAVLEDGGYQVDVAQDGAAGLAAVATGPPDAIISDIIMPGVVDGYEVCRQVKAGPHRDVPVLLLTSLSDPTDIIRALECGADNFLRKPYEARYLLERLRVLFTTREIRAKDRVHFGMKVMFLGREVTINAEHQQVLDLLISTFEEAVIQNRELRQREGELRAAKAELDRHAGALEQRLKSVLDAIPDVLFSVDASLGNLFYVSPAARLVFGYSPEEMLADPQLWRRSIHCDDLPRVLEGFNKAVDAKSSQTVECRISTRSGEARWLELSVAAVPDDVHGGVRLDGVAHEITARKRAADELALNHAIISTQQETSLDGILVVDEQGKIVSFNRRFVELWEIPPEVAESGSDQRALESVIGRLVDPDGFLARVTYLYEHREERSEEEIALRDGRTFDRYSAPMFGADGRYYGRVWYFRDITARKHAEQALKASEARLQSLFAGIDDALFVHDADGRIIDCNEAACRRLGYSRDELLAMRTADVDAPEFAVGFGERTSQQLLRGRYTCEGLHITKDGRHIPVDINSTLIDYGGQPAVLAVMRDITGRKQAEEALRRSEAEHRGLVEHAPLGISRSTPDGRFLSANQALVTMLGYESADELLQLDLRRDLYTDPEDWARVTAQVQSQGAAKVETPWKRKDGTLVTVRLNVRGVRNPAGELECYEALVEDVTEQRSLENQLRQAQRLEAVGRLAGGVAHDFNNVLTAITGYSELLLDELDANDPKRRDVEEIRAAGQRAAGLTRQLLAFSRKQVLQTRVLDVNQVVRTLEMMLRRLIGEDVKLEVSLDSALGAVRADPGQLEQIIMNLAVNSRDAMPGGGRLTIETVNVDLDEAYARKHAAALPGRYVMLAVSDTGVGMDAETQSHIFEPFYTTKEQSAGTGLGLSTVYGIVKQSGGYVWVYSEPGGGATFKIYLPRVDEPVEAPEPGAAARPAAGGRETVLLAEDDPSVRAIVAEVLTQKGYRVLQAPDGQTALEIARAQPGAIQLLVTDLVMPGMTGRELAEAVAAERAGVRVLYMSGYTDDAVVRHGVLTEGMPYLQKPFSPSSLAAKVREVLDRVSAAAPF